MASNVEELINKCDKKLAMRFYINLVHWSFTGYFKKLQDIPLNKLDSNDLTLIEICENRLDRAKTFLNDIAVVFGFGLVALSIILTIDKDKIPFLVPDSSIIIIAASLVLLLFALLALLAHYRAQAHAWYAFKEKALLMKQPEN